MTSETIHVETPVDVCDRCGKEADDERKINGRNVALCSWCAEDFDEAEERRAMEAHDPNACPGCGGSCLRACR